MRGAKAGEEWQRDRGGGGRRRVVAGEEQQREKSGVIVIHTRPLLTSLGAAVPMSHSSARPFGIPGVAVGQLSFGPAQHWGVVVRLARWGPGAPSRSCVMGWQGMPVGIGNCMYGFASDSQGCSGAGDTGEEGSAVEQDAQQRKGVQWGRGHRRKGVQRGRVAEE